jgi:hypothetical protein
MDSAKLSMTRRPHLLRFISPPDRELVIPLFFYYFSVEDTTSGHALLSCLPQTISMAEDDALHAAILSVGYSILANITNSSHKLLLARREYGTAVRLTHDALETSVPSETCQIVRIIVLLAFFEVRSPRLVIASSSIMSMSIRRAKFPAAGINM